MRTVYKYRIDPEPDRDRVGEMDGPVVLAGRDASGVLSVWIEGDSEAPRRERTFQVFGTGHKISEGYEHRGSFFDLSFVWHVYEKVS